MKQLLNSILSHLGKFYPIWIVFAALIITAGLSNSFEWATIKHIAWAILIIFCILITLHPLNVVYGLIGTKGHVSTYVILLIIINVIFSFVYYRLIFKNAGITYDVNQPHISYTLFIDKPDTITTLTITGDAEKIKIFNQNDSLVSYWAQPGETHHYQKIDKWFVIKNTFMTSLMQEPSDFFAIASTYNQGVIDFPTETKLDQQKSELFHWLLILQVFISWIFFGVFISILYNKFRYES